MDASIEELWSVSDKVLVTAYADARRRYAEKKLERSSLFSSGRRREELLEEIDRSRTAVRLADHRLAELGTQASDLRGASAQRLTILPCPAGPISRRCRGRPKTRLQRRFPSGESRN